MDQKLAPLPQPKLQNSLSSWFIQASFPRFTLGRFFCLLKSTECTGTLCARDFTSSIFTDIFVILENVAERPSRGLVIHWRQIVRVRTRTIAPKSAFRHAPSPSSLFCTRKYTTRCTQKYCQKLTFSVMSVSFIFGSQKAAGNDKPAITQRVHI